MNFKTLAAALFLLGSISTIAQVSDTTEVQAEAPAQAEAQVEALAPATPVPAAPVEKATDKLPWPSLSSLYYDYKARKALGDKNPELALEYELKILEQDPMSLQTHSNLGVIFDMLQKKDESAQSFDLALNILERYKDQLTPADIFQIYYNLGLRYHNAKETALALDFYQKALDVNPASIETKHNIELLIQQQQGGGGSGKNDQQDQKGKGDQNKDQKDDEKDKKDKDQEQDREQTSKYKPRPFKGDQLSEADVKKILGELSQQDKKIRANYNKKERKEDKNAKDW